MRLKLIAVGLCVVLSGCSGLTGSAKTSTDFKITLQSFEPLLGDAIDSAEFAPCTVMELTGTGDAWCSFLIEITNLADSPKSLSGNFYAVVDEKIFLGTDGVYVEGPKLIPSTLNPGESKKGMVFFTVPANSRIHSIFIGPETSSSPNDAILSLDVNVVATDDYTP